jgi:hypothetical protein
MKQRVARGLAFAFCLLLGTSVALIKLPNPFKDRNISAAGNAQAELSFPELYEPQIAVPDAPIRDIDFSNFTYPSKPIYSDGAKTFTLKDGKFKGRNRNPGLPAPFGLPYPLTLVAVIYGDVTGDEKQDAIVIINEETAGTDCPDYGYIYGIEDNRAWLIWSFAMGARADGGLRNIFAEDGELVIELYGKGARVEGKLYGTDDSGACCPRFITRTRYQWRNGKFRRKGESKNFPNPYKDSSFGLPHEVLRW